MNDLVSIIIPVYNVEEYLERCLNSIVGQNYKNLDIILVDDGSTDNSGKICDEYLEKDNRIRVIHKENDGVSSARNTGIELSKGSYIMFFDSDDFLEKDAIEYMMKIFDHNDIDLVVGNYIVKYSTGEEDRVCKIKENKTLGNEEFYKIVHEMLPVVANKLYKSSIIKQHNLKFPNLKVAEDLNFYLKYILFAKNIFVTNKYLFDYCILKNSSSRTSDLRCLDTFYSFDDLEEFTKNYELPEDFVRLVARIKLIYYNFEISAIVRCENKNDRTIMVKEFYKRTKKLKQIMKNANNKCLDIYIKLKIKKFLLPIYMFYLNKIEILKK